MTGLNESQRKAVETTEGPVLLIAGPGAGKTLTLVHRTLHILQQGLAKPGEVVLCTFTEKAAFELRDRLRGAAQGTALDIDLSGLRTGTIHGICNEFLDRFRHLTPLGNGYEVLDDLTQLLFLFQHFDEVIGPADDEGHYFRRWSLRVTIGVRGWVDAAAGEPLLGAARLPRD